jgi:hypothetical protein
LPSGNYTGGSVGTNNPSSSTTRSSGATASRTTSSGSMAVGASRSPSSGPGTTRSSGATASRSGPTSSGSNGGSQSGNMSTGASRSGVGPSSGGGNAPGPSRSGSTVGGNTSRDSTGARGPIGGDGRARQGGGESSRSGGVFSGGTTRSSVGGPGRSPTSFGAQRTGGGAQFGGRGYSGPKGVAGQGLNIGARTATQNASRSTYSGPKGAPTQGLNPGAIMASRGYRPEEAGSRTLSHDPFRDDVYDGFQIDNAAAKRGPGWSPTGHTYSGPKGTILDGLNDQARNAAFNKVGIGAIIPNDNWGSRYANATPDQKALLQSDMFSALGARQPKTNPKWGDRLYRGVLESDRQGVLQKQLDSPQGLPFQFDPKRDADMLGRTPAQAMQNYVNRTRVPQEFQGVMYTPNPNLTLTKAAPPWSSPHVFGIAADFDDGPLRSFMQSPEVMGEFGYETVAGDAPHIQMAGARNLVKTGQVAMVEQGRPMSITRYAGLEPQKAASTSVEPEVMANVPTPRQAPPGMKSYIGEAIDYPGSVVEKNQSVEDPFQGLNISRNQFDNAPSYNIARNPYDSTPTYNGPAMARSGVNMSRGNFATFAEQDPGSEPVNLASNSQSLWNENYGENRSRSPGIASLESNLPAKGDRGAIQVSGGFRPTSTIDPAQYGRPSSADAWRSTSSIDPSSSPSGTNFTPMSQIDPRQQYQAPSPVNQQKKQDRLPGAVTADLVGDWSDIFGTPEFPNFGDKQSQPSYPEYNRSMFGPLPEPYSGGNPPATFSGSGQPSYSFANFPSRPVMDVNEARTLSQMLRGLGGPESSASTSPAGPQSLPQGPMSPQQESQSVTTMQNGRDRLNQLRGIVEGSHRINSQREHMGGQMERFPRMSPFMNYRDAGIMGNVSPSNPGQDWLNAMRAGLFYTG